MRVLSVCNALQMSDTSLPPAGWYIYPDGNGGQRWWDGSQWTEAVAPATPPSPPINTQQPTPFAQQQAALVQQPVFQTSNHLPGVGAEKASMAVLCIILGLFCFPLSIVSLILSGSAHSESKRTGRPLDGAMKAAYIIGMIELILWVLFVVIVIISSAHVAATGSSQ